VRRAHAILLLGLLLGWVDPASAQKIYTLTVSIHEDVHPRLTRPQAEKILKDASALLHRCGVGFKLGEGPLGTFTSQSAPAVISDPDSLERVHGVPADVKVVKKIKYCALGQQQTGLVGCSWRDNNLRRTMIVTPEMMAFNAEHIVLTHEFGHTTGLPHRTDDRHALMWPCDLDVINWSITDHECDSFRAGPTTHYLPGLGPQCSSRQRRARPRTE
jgi:hypothetical protein